MENKSCENHAYCMHCKKNHRPADSLECVELDIQKKNKKNNGH